MTESASRTKAAKPVVNTATLGDSTAEVLNSPKGTAQKNSAPKNSGQNRTRRPSTAPHGENTPPQVPAAASGHAFSASLRSGTKSVSKPWRGGAAAANKIEDAAATPPQAKGAYRTPRAPQSTVRRQSGHGTRIDRGHASAIRSAPNSPRGSTGSLRHSDEFSSFAEEEDNVDCVKVVVRVRPINEKELREGSDVQSVTQIGAKQVEASLPGHGQPYLFAFDHIAGRSASQEDIFMCCGHPIVENCLAGYNSSIFAYGQTGAGKTYTMLGSLSDDEKRGLAPRVFEHIFKRIAEEEDTKGREKLRFNAKVSYLEIYNETITDLLNPAATNLQIREDMKKGCYVEGLSEAIVMNVDDAMALMKRGAENRRIGETKMNRESSRSHSVFTCIVEQITKLESGLTQVRFSRLNLVDLAGSERNKASGATGEHFKEACSINKSLTTLGRVIMELVEAQRQDRRNVHIPYRDSRLTFLLQESLGGNSKTMIIANISPSETCAHESLSTLQFAARAKYIRNRAVVNEDTAGDVAQLNAEIARLNRELELVRETCTEPVVQENLELREQIVQLEKERQELLHKVDFVQGEARALRTEARWAEEKIAQLEGHEESTEQSLKALNAKVEETEAAAAAAQAAAAALHEAQLAAAAAAQKAVEDKLALEEAGRVQAEQSVLELQGRLAALQSSLKEEASTAEADRQGLTSRLSEVAHAKANLDAAVGKLKQDLESTTAELRAAEGREQGLAAEVDRLGREGAALQRELAAAREATQQLAAMKEAETARLLQELDEVQSAAGRAGDEVDALSSDRDRLSSECDRLRVDLENAQAAGAKFKAQRDEAISEKQQEVNEARSAVKEEQRGVEEREGLIRRLQAQLRDTADDFAIRDRRQKAEIESLTKAAQEAKQTAEEARAELNEEIVRSARYKRAMTEIDTLIVWARTPPNSARSRGSTPPASTRYRLSHNPLPSPSGPSLNNAFASRRLSDASSRPPPLHIPATPTDEPAAPTGSPPAS